MLTPQELAVIAETMQPHLDELNMWISQDMIRRFMARMGRGEKNLLSGTDEWQAQVYKEAGGLFEDLQKELHKFTGKSEDEIKAIFEDAGIRAWNADDVFYVAQGFESVPLLSSERMMNILTDCYQRTNNEVYNFTRTTAKETQKQFIKLLDTTHMKVMSGAQSYTAAVKDAVNELASTQTEVVYPSGHKDTIETAVLRAVRTGVAQASGNITLQGMEERDWDLIRVSAHLGARYGDGGENPGNHFWWQGKLYSRTGRDKRYPDFMTATGYGTGEGLCGWNCRHSYGPGDPDHNPYKDYDAEENKKAYDLSQKQRKIERTIRADKLKVKGLREAIDCAEDEALKKELSEDYEKASARLSMHNAEYNHFCENNGLKRYYDRLSIAKWNRSEAMKAVRAAQRYKKSSASVAKSENSGIIKTGDDNMGLSLEIDRFTPCLVRRNSGEILNTNYSVADTDELKFLNKKGWKFHWRSKDLKNSTVYKLCLKNDDEIQGLIAVTDYPRDRALYINIAESAPHNLGKNKEFEGVGGHLFAIAANESVKKGYDGFLFLDAKNMELVSYYKEKFGATLLGMPHPYRMFIDEESAKKLLEIYTLKGE